MGRMQNLFMLKFTYAPITYQDMALTAHPLIALKLKKARIYTSIPPIHAFMACHKMNRTITFYI